MARRFSFTGRCSFLLLERAAARCRSRHQYFEPETPEYPIVLRAHLLRWPSTAPACLCWFNLPLAILGDSHDSGPTRRGVWRGAGSNENGPASALVIQLTRSWNALGGHLPSARQARDYRLAADTHACIPAPQSRARGSKTVAGVIRCRWPGPAAETSQFEVVPAESPQRCLRAGR
jgi:hypothetical protein